MKLLAKCPECKQLTEFGPEAADRRLRCAWCKKKIKIPPAGELADSPMVIRTGEGAVFIDDKGQVYG
jgi:hypothetical protein